MQEKEPEHTTTLRYKFFSKYEKDVLAREPEAFSLIDWSVTDDEIFNPAIAKLSSLKLNIGELKSLITHI